MTQSESFVRSFTHLKDKPNSERALQMLQKVASLVKPIMRKHGWILPVLAEFFPESPNLLGLNINHGEKICLRLRYANSPDLFYDEVAVVQTMLHELTHNVHGPHNEKFYEFLSALQDEYDALQRSGYAGEGFFSEGHRLGTGVSHNLPPHQARLKALEAAEKRKQVSHVLGNRSGTTLGGRTKALQSLSPRELAAQAAERRARDDKACGQGALADLEASKAAKNSVIIDLTGDDSDDDVIVVEQNPSVVAGPSGVTSRSGSRLKARTAVVNRSKSSSSTRSVLKDTTATLINASSEWTCATCTLINKVQSLQCEVCLTQQPRDLSTNEGWSCSTCGESRIPHEFWSCRFCGTIKLTS